MKIKSLLQVGLLLHMIVAPVAAHASGGASDIGSGRLLPTVAAVIGLIGVVIGRLALSRSRRPGNRRIGAIVAVVLGLISLIVGGLHAANSAGGFGTGNGRAGAIVAMVLGLVATVLGGLARVRSQRTATGNTATPASTKERT
jgi:hypothetical protein